MQPSSSITSVHILQCVFLSLLWGVTASSITTSDTTLATTLSTTPTTTPLPTPTTKPPPENVKYVDVLGQNESSITLKWDKVDNISTYFLLYDNKEDTISVSHQNTSITHVVTALTAGTKYHFTLITASEGVNSTGYRFEAVTAPHNTNRLQSIGQNESSITLQWEKVDDILDYILVFNGSEINVTASEELEVTHTILELRSGTKYDFRLLTVFENVRSSGVNITAVTAPRNTNRLQSIGQNESSITLQWEKVDDILDYILVFNGSEINVTASEELEVTHTILELRSGTKYDFRLLTVFENVRSSGVNITAVTAPENVKYVDVLGQNESSITLKWDKVDNISTYFLLYDNKEDTISVSHQNTSITHVVTALTAGTKYHFTLITASEGVNSTGYRFEAVTAPRNADGLESIGQNESSITLQWEKVDDILDYILVFNGSEINVTASEKLEVTHTILELRSGTKYDFRLLTVFENVRSSGVNITAATAPENVKYVDVLGQNESSITLKWDKVDNISTYFLLYDNKEDTISVSHQNTSITHVVTALTAGTKYHFTLITASEGVNSTGYRFEAVTAPRNADGLESIGQNESSITLQWEKVDDILDYILVFNGSEINVTASEELEVTHTILELRSGTKYDFRLLTVFENVRSSGVNITAVTAPRNTNRLQSIGQNESSITLQWEKVDDILDYILVFSGSEINVTASEELEVTHTILELRSGTKYDFRLLTVFENVRSSGVNITAATAPENVKYVDVLGQNESSITLKWDKVDNISTYFLLYDNKEDTISVSHQNTSITHVVTALTAGTKYHFTLITPFEKVNSTGYRFEAVTAPRNADGLESIGQNESSITLQWEKVDDILDYILVFNGSEINVTASEELEVTHTILELRSGTKYDFRLLTVFENVRSSGVNITAATAPENVKYVDVLGQNESSITLKWDKVDNISTYFLLYDNKEDTISVSHQNTSITHVVTALTAGTKYHFTLITPFEKVNSTGFSFNAVTVPLMVNRVSVTDRSVTSITLTWQKEKNDWDYFLQINEEHLQLLLTNRIMDDVSHTITPLQPGTEYNFSVITTFAGFNSTAYKNFTVTAINCSSVTWHVTTSSIHGMIKGLFTSAKATNTSQTHESHGGSNVSFTGLYPGATYEVSLEYESHNQCFHQCSHNLTTFPPHLNAHCEYWGSGYSIFIVWDEPYGMWTAVEVNVTGKIYTALENEGLVISGFLPARRYAVSVTSLSGNVRSYEPCDFSCLTDPRGVIAGSVFGVLFFCVLVCLAVFIFLRRPDIISRKKSFIGGSRQVNKKCKAISVTQFPDHFHQLGMDENRGFSQEYESLFSVGTNQTRTAALSPENKVKNRFNNVLPYDWCRVKLATSGTSDYINASYMPGYNSNREYIATQGPLPSTVNDFWRMIWEQRVKTIVMVTNCSEGGRTKCERYWPAEGKACPYGELLITVRSEQQGPNWTWREFRVTHSNTSEERTVKHFHFTAWPDHGVPQGTEVLIQFRGLVRGHMEEEGAGAPTVVHCSAGVGRTGTIIALDVLLQQLEKERAVGINAFVHKMRLSRPHMVQTESQYVFLHQSIMDCLQPNETTEENIYENAEMIYTNATALREFHKVNTKA